MTVTLTQFKPNLFSNCEKWGIYKMLSIKSLTIAYGKRTILDDVSIEFRRGTITVIKGESGSGKSSLLNVLGLMQTASNCEYTFDDNVVSNFNDTQRADFRLHNLGFVFQQSNLIQELTAKENLIVPMSIAWQEDDLDKKADELIKYVGLDEVKNSYPSSLSGGEEQRLAIARAIANDADIILADEPTASLDAKNATKVLELFSKLAHELNKIVIVVSHSEFVEKYADVVCEIKDENLVITKSAIAKEAIEPAETPKNASKRRNAWRFVRYYSRKRTVSRSLNGVFVAVTALVAAIAMLATNFGANIAQQQASLINAITDNSVFVINNTLGHGAPFATEGDLSIPPGVIAQIASNSGVSNVYPWYKLISDGIDYDNKAGQANIKVTDGDTALIEKSFPNEMTQHRPDDTFIIIPQYDEEDISYLLEYKSESDISSGLVLTSQVASQLSTNPAELIGKQIEITCFVPVKLYEGTATTFENDEFGNPTGVTTKIDAEMYYYKLITFKSTISGILPRSYSMQRESGLNYIFMNYNQLMGIIEQYKDTNIGERFPGFPEKELGPNALLVFANSYSDVPSVTSEIENLSQFFLVANNAADIKAIQNDLASTKNMLTVVTTVFICVVVVAFGMLYYLKNRARKKEIGILKAIGFTRANITTLTSVEMLKMALPAFAISVVLAFILAYFGNRLSYFSNINGQEYLSVSVSSVLVGLLVCIAVVILSGLLPIYSASKIDPIEAIRKTHK